MQFFVRRAYFDQLTKWSPAQSAVNSFASGLRAYDSVIRLSFRDKCSSDLQEPDLSNIMETLAVNSTQLRDIGLVEFLGLRFNRMSQVEAVNLLLGVAKSNRSCRVYFANANSVEICQRDNRLQRALERSDLLLADGSGVLWGSRLAGNPLKFNLNGTDLVPALCDVGQVSNLSVYFLGAKPGVGQRASQQLSRKFPGMVVAGVQHGYFAENQTDAVLATIRAAKPDVLLVAMGTPMQEIWIDRYANMLPGITCIAVGGLFDFIAGDVARAPYVFRALGFEWLWRLLMEPRRLWKRYIVGNFVYLCFLLKFLAKARLQKTLGSQEA